MGIDIELNMPECDNSIEKMNKIVKLKNYEEETKEANSKDNVKTMDYRVSRIYWTS